MAAMTSFQAEKCRQVRTALHMQSLPGAYAAAASVSFWFIVHSYLLDKQTVNVIDFVCVHF